MHAYIDAHSQRLIGECTGYGVQDISIFQYQCVTMKFSNQIRYNRMFKQVVQKGGSSSINYIKIFQNTKASVIKVGNIYTEYQLMQTFLEILH